MASFHPSINKLSPPGITFGVVGNPNSDRYKLMAGCVVFRYDGFSEKPKLSNDAVRLVHGWVIDRRD